MKRSIIASVLLQPACTGLPIILNLSFPYLRAGNRQELMELSIFTRQKQTMNLLLFVTKTFKQK